MGEFQKDWVDAYFDHGIDIANRRVFITGDIDEESIGAAIKGLYLMETNNREERIEMFISSFGGDLYEAMALYDIINTISCPIHTFAYGKCMSAAPLLLAAGEPGHRWVAPHVAFMAHDVSYGVDGKLSHIKGDLVHVADLNETRLRLMATLSNKDYKFWSNRSNRTSDFYFTADEAIEWGLADHIWVEK